VCNAPLSHLRISTTPEDKHSWNSKLVPFEDGWQMEHIELLYIVTGWMWALRLSFGLRLRSSCLMMLTPSRSSMLRNHGSPKRQCLIPFTTEFTSPPIGRGTNPQHHSISNLLLLRLSYWQPLLIIVCCLNMPVERGPRLYFIKMNIEVHLAHPLRSILL
jgi:hypothetical protein